MPAKEDDPQLTAEQVLSDIDSRMDRTLDAFRRDPKEYRPMTGPVGPALAAADAETENLVLLDWLEARLAAAGVRVAAISLLSRNLEKRRDQATTVIVFLASNLLKFALYSLLGFFTWRTVAAGLYLAPVAVLGTFLGVRLHGLLPERAYFAVVYVCLTLAGIKLVFDALT